jgi:hypothetical protein
MSLTESAAVFASVHENALNDALTAFCTDRPRYLVFGSPSFVPVTTVAETSMAAIAFPGVSGGIQWRIRFAIPHVDLFKQTDPLPPELSLGPGQFSVHLSAELCLDCGRLRIDPHPPRDQTGLKAPNERPKDPGKGDRHPLREVTCCKLDVFAVGRIVHVLTTSGEDAITFEVDAVEIVDISPDEVESVLECLLFMILQAVLADIRLPLRALRVGAFQLVLTQGPLVEDDQIKVRGDF